MPLKSGKSKKTIQKNITELMGSYKKKGKLGTSHPKSAKQAAKQAAAIAYAKAKKTKKAKAHKKKINENYMVLGFIKSLVDKNYKEADKYLQGQVDKLITNKIRDAVDKANN